MPQVTRDNLNTETQQSSQQWGIQDFYALAQEVDFARIHQFRIIEWLHNGKPVFEDDRFRIYLETAALPGKEITTTQVSYIGMEFNVPLMVKYTGTASHPITLRCDQFYIIRQAIEKCITETFDDETSKAFGLTPGETSYMIIGLIDKSNEIVIKYKLIGTSLNNTGTIQYNTGDSGQIAKVETTLSYHYWRRIEE